MLTIFLMIPLLQLSTAAVLKPSDAKFLGLDDSAMLYELPDYEDPQMLEYELSQLEGHPLVSLIHLARKHVQNKNRHVLSKEAIDNFKVHLDSVLTRLQTLQTRLENGSTDVPVEDIEKSIQDLETMKTIVRPNMDQLMTAMNHGMPHPEKHPVGGMLNVRSRHRPAIEVTTAEAVIYELIPLTTETPIHEKKAHAIKPHVHEIESLPTKIPVYEIESLSTKGPVYEMEPSVTKSPVYEVKKLVTEKPVFALPSTEAPQDSGEEKERRIPYKDEMFRGETMKERYEMNPYQSRWTWKTQSFVK